jgi:lipopolysaccharide export system protein LptC
MTYKYTIISFILITCFLSLMTFLSHRSVPLSNEIAVIRPDAIMEDVHALIMNQQGRPEMKIVTPKMIHFIENDTTNLIAPKLTLYRKSPNPWYITARFGKATQGIENVDFWDNVTIHHAADQNNPATLIKTSTLTVHPKQKTAETKAFITMVQPQIIIKAIGMRANMNTGDINLLAQTRGEYAPNS